MTPTTNMIVVEREREVPFIWFGVIPQHQHQHTHSLILTPPTTHMHTLHYSTAQHSSPWPGHVVPLYFSAFLSSSPLRTLSTHPTCTSPTSLAHNITTLAVLSLL
jgi:hypothetical protein